MNTFNVGDFFSCNGGKTHGIVVVQSGENDGETHGADDVQSYAVTITSGELAKRVPIPKDAVKIATLPQELLVPLSAAAQATILVNNYSK